MQKSPQCTRAINGATYYIICADFMSGIVAEIIDESPDEVALFRAGKTKLRKVLMGRCMKRARGRADPKRLGEALDEALV